jgi:putative selenium metabolism protein SsnA
MLLKGATVAAFDPPLVERADLRLDGARIVERGARLLARDGEETVDLAGHLIVPGLVNAHTHLYSALARGMPMPAAPPRSFVEVLERIWWRLDRALDEPAVRASALVGGLEAALSGTTLLVDHHSSPSFIGGSLRTIRAALEEVGIRSVLCYEVTDRHGEAGRAEGLKENVEFQAAHQSELTRGMVGAHASFTLSEDALQGLAEAVRQTGSSLHVHVAEDRVDVEDCRARYDEGVPDRFHRHGLLIARTLFAHCVHLSAAEIEASHARGAWIAHNPRSNQNNAVGYAPTAAIRRGALGTDGIDQDMLAEARACFFRMREAGRADAAEATLQLLAGGHRLASALFGLPFGKLDAGGPADLLVLRYAPPTPLHTGNLAAHLLFGTDRSHVRSVLVAGRWIVRDGLPAALDAAPTFTHAQDEAERLWRRMAELPA